MDKLRQEEKGAYTSSKAEQEKGLAGVKLALKVLKEYYASDAAHEAATGAAGGIISLLEVVESDMTKMLAALVTQEETAKDQDVAYKAKESARLDKATSEDVAYKAKE